VFTSNLISQTTWLKVKLKLVNLHSITKCSFYDIDAVMFIKLMASKE